MNRRIVDRDLRSWEVYATTGAFGEANPAKVAFRCDSDASQRPRVFLFDGDKSDAERVVQECSESELQSMLESSKPIA
jgi:hypothetical protein